MKKIMVSMCIILCTNLGGCIFRSKSRVERFSEEMESEKGMADNMMENIGKALDNGDAKAVKELYAEPAIEATPDLDEQIDALIDYYHGNMESCKGIIHSSTSYESGKETLELQGRYQLTTENESYRIDYIYIAVDDVNSKNIGLYKVEFTTEEEYQKEVEAHGGYYLKYNDEKTGAYYSYSDID